MAENIQAEEEQIAEPAKDNANAEEAKRQQAIEDAAYQAAVTTQVRRTKDVGDEIDFTKNLDKLDAVLEEDTITVTFAVGEDEFNFELEPMTPGEMAVYYSTMFGHSLLSSVGNPLDLNETQITESAVQIEKDKESVRLFDDRLLSILESKIRRPTGITIDRLKRWDPYYLNKLYNALVDGGLPSKPVARFS